MNAKWTSWVVAGAIGAIVSSQALAQPWAGEDRRPRMSGMNQGPTAVRPERGRMGSGAWRPMGGGPRGSGMWSSGFSGQCAGRLGLTDVQLQKIAQIVDETRSRTRAAIKEVLTEEQVRQFEQMCPRAAQFARPGRGPAMQNDSTDRAGGRGFRRGNGQRYPMNADGWRPTGRGQRARWSDQSERQDDRPDGAVQSPAAPQSNRPLPFIEQRFDEADANHDGALTREEIRAFHDTMASGRGWQRQ